jgi:arylsulfatase A-like enzyme
VDIAATVLARAGLAPQNGNQGRDLMNPEARDPDTPVIIEEHQRYGYMGLGDGFRARTLMGRRWRFTVYDDGEIGASGLGELYDLENDPLEQINLFDNPDHQAIRAELTNQLLHQVMNMVDTSPLATHHGP